MRNPEGAPIWYELLSDDAEASKAFYEDVVGWKVHPPQPGDDKGYRTIDTGSGFVGGLMPLNESMRAGGAKPTWLFYIGVEDVDATAKKVEAAGGTILMAPFDIPDVGRVAMINDPQGIPLYIMRGSVDSASAAFERHGMGKCNWHELATPDQAAAHAFYEQVFGWKYPDKMSMGPAGDYVFVAAADTTIGATMPRTPNGPSGWQFYFRTPDIDVAVEKVKKAGGKIHAGPMEVPGGDKVIVASDPHGVAFGIAAPGVPAKT